MKGASLGSSGEAGEAGEEEGAVREGLQCSPSSRPFTESQYSCGGGVYLGAKGMREEKYHATCE